MRPNPWKPAARMKSDNCSSTSLLYASNWRNRMSIVNKVKDGVRPKRERYADEQAATLLGFLNELAALGSLEEQLTALVGMTTEVSGADRSTIFLHDPSMGELYSHVAQGERHMQLRVPDTVGIVGHVFTT